MYLCGFALCTSVVSVVGFLEALPQRDPRCTENDHRRMVASLWFRVSGYEFHKEERRNARELIKDAVEAPAPHKQF